VFAIGFLLFALNFIGGGDAKLLAAVALWAGPEHILDLLLVTALAGGGLSLILLSPMKYVLEFASPTSPATPANGDGKGKRPKRCVPYAVAIAIGTIVAMPDIPLL
jgi:prepilin peptidase CpaA